MEEMGRANLHYSVGGMLEGELKARSQMLQVTLTPRAKRQKQDCQPEIKPGVQMGQETRMKGEQAKSK